MISKNRIDHAILTGFSSVCLHKRPKIILFIAISYDEVDLPPPINDCLFRSKCVKLRNLLIDHFEHNDDWICQMKQNINNTLYTKGYGEVVYGAYAAENVNIEKKCFGLTHCDVNMLRQIHNLCFYKLGYKYMYGINAHASTRLYSLAVDNVLNNVNNYKNVNYNCQGYVKTTSIWNFSKYRPFVEYDEKTMMDNYNVDDNLCWLSCSYDNYQIIKNNGLSLKQYWNWQMYTIYKQIGKEFVRLKLKHLKKEKEKSGEREMQLQKVAQENIVSKL